MTPRHDGARRPPSRIAVLLAGLALLLVAAAAVLAESRPRVAEVDPLREEIERRAGVLDAAPWQRTPLRDGFEGDVTRPLDEAIAGLHAARKRIGAIPADDLGFLPPDDPDAEAPRLHHELEAVRGAARGDTVQVQLVPLKGSPPTRLGLAAVCPLLRAVMRDATTSPRECLEIATDVVRFDQDVLADHGLSLGGTCTEHVAKAAVACARHAAAADLAAASWELDILARELQPLVVSARIEALRRAHVAAPTPPEGLLERLMTWGERDTRHETAASLLEIERKLTTLGSPDDFAAVRASIEGVDLGSPWQLEVLVAQRASTRMLALAVDWLAGRWTAPQLPGGVVGVDPFSGVAFEVRQRPGGGIALRSSGPRRPEGSRWDHFVLEVAPGPSAETAPLPAD